jgi:hypothetical protein
MRDMRAGKRPGSLRILTAAAGVALGVAVGVAGCGRSPATPQQSPPPARMEQIGRGVPSVVLTPAGAARIGVRTTPAAAAAGGMTVIPYSALLYEPDGTAAVYVNTSPLIYTRSIISVGHIAGDQVYVSRGLAPGMRVVTVGAEELLGVQNGVGEET